MERYPDISDHGIIGNLRTSALQAFTHLSLINSAITLNRDLGRRAAHADRATAAASILAAV